MKRGRGEGDIMLIANKEAIDYGTFEKDLEDTTGIGESLKWAVKNL